MPHANRIFNLISVLLLFAPIAARSQTPPRDFRIILFPDTQNEAQFFPQVLQSETQWVVANQVALNIQAVLGLGDIVNDGASTSQQQNADAAIRILDNAGLPYLLAIGNHDYDGAKPATRAVTGFNQWWGPARYSGKPYYGQSFPGGSNENFYGVLTIDGKQYLILVLEFIPRTESLNWAASVVQANLDKEVILVTHSYLFSDGTRADRCDSNDSPSGANDGDAMWDTFVSQYPNIIMVVNGHFTNGNASRRADLGENGNLVNQMFSNYQTLANGGDGWLRILTFHPQSNTIDVQTYSPFLNTYKTDAQNQFTIFYHNPGFDTGVGKVSGRVRSSGCKSIAGATVSAGSASAVTDSGGHYSLSLPAPGNYPVTVSAAGWKAATNNALVSDNYSTDSNFYLSAAPPCDLNPASPSVTICTPVQGSTVSSPVHVLAGSTDSHSVSQMQLWVDGVKSFTSSGGTLDTQLPLASGAHRLTVVAFDSSSVHFQQVVNITVGTKPPPPPPPPPQCSLNPASPSVTICTPTQGATVASPVHLVAGSTDSQSVSQMQVWVDGVKNSQSNGGTLDVQIVLPVGTHRIAVVAIDSSSTHFQQAISVTVH